MSGPSSCSLYSALPAKRTWAIDNVILLPSYLDIIADAGMGYSTAPLNTTGCFGYSTIRS